jgi:hypothetical protein
MIEGVRERKKRKREERATSTSSLFCKGIPIQSITWAVFLGRVEMNKVAWETRGRKIFRLVERDFVRRTSLIESGLYRPFVNPYW